MAFEDKYFPYTPDLEPAIYCRECKEVIFDTKCSAHRPVRSVQASPESPDRLTSGNAE